MNLNGTVYILKETGRNLWKNSWMALASVSTVAISMVVLAFFLVISINVNHVTSVLQSQVELRVFIKPTATRTQEMMLLDQAKHWPHVRRISFFTKAQAAKQLQAEFPRQQDLLKLIAKSNPLFDGFDVYTARPNQIAQVASRFEHQPITHSVVYQGTVVTRLTRLSSVLKWAGWIIEGLLTVATLFIIVNTIRLAVFARRKEIQIMKLVGATDWFIRWPFILEGFLLGLFGAVAAQLVVTNAYYWLIQKAAVSLPFWPLAPGSEVAGQTALFTLLGGSLIGILASLVAVRRFLRI